MKLSAPVFILKQQARVVSRTMNVRLHQALDQIANSLDLGLFDTTCFLNRGKMQISTSN